MLNKFGFEYLFSYYANIGDFYRMPKSPFGLRQIGYITDGRVWGDKVNGELAPGAATGASSERTASPCRMSAP